VIVRKCDGLGPVIPQFDGNVTDDTMAYFSNFEPVVKVAVPGLNIFSTYNGTGYAIESEQVWLLLVWQEQQLCIRQCSQT
jgi:hypothetical protein